MNWRLVLILLKLIDRFGFPYFLVLVSFWFAKAIGQELQRRVTSPSLSSRWSALSAKQRHKNNQRPSAMKKIMKFSLGKLLSTGFVILAALVVAVVSVRGSSCTPPPPGLVGWWTAEGSALDSAGGNNGTLMNGTGFTNGEVGTAFNLNGANNFVLVNPASTNLDVGQGDGFTIEGWVNPTTLANDLPFVEYEKSLGTFNGSDVGVHFYVSVQSSPGSLYANIVETNGVVGHQITSPAGLVTTSVWQHIALSYSKTTGMGTIYLNGAVVAQQNFGSFTPQTSFTNILIGARTTFGSIASPSIKFAGKLDEVSVYNRALSASEIQAIYNAGSAGKCAPVTTACTPPPAGIVGWWKGDGTALDSVSANNGVNQNVAYTNGVVGQAFAFDPENFSYGTYTGIQVADRPAYALTNALTIETWLRPRGNGYVIFFRGDHRPGMDPYYLSMQANNTLRFGVCDAAGNSGFVETTVNYFAWTHVAATLNGAAGTLSLYTNGVLAAQTVTAVRPFADLLPDQSPGIGIGNVNDGGNNFPFIGDIDEIALYNRALSQAEIQSIANAGGAGKCVPTATACVTPPSGLVAWWPAEGNALDAIGGNNGTLLNGAGFVAGEVGQAFLFGTTNAGVQVPASPMLDVGLGSGLTVEGWINPSNLSVRGEIAEWNNGDTNEIVPYGVHLSILSPGELGLGAGNLFSDLHGADGQVHWIMAPGGTITANTFQHVALTYDKGTGVATLYCNGAVVAQQTLGSFTPLTSYDFYIGRRPAAIGSVHSFSGSIDELSVYSRSLSVAEIQSIYNAGGAGKCAPQTGMLSQQLINIDFGAGGGRGYSLKTGFAAIGQATNDFWNFYDRDVSPSPYDWRTSGALVNLQLANGALTTVGVSVSDAPGAWNDESSDSMYKTYDYPLDGGNNVVTFTNLAAGQYDVLAYSPDGNFEVTVGGISYCV